MDDKTLDALKRSIAKWESNAVAKKPKDYLTGASSCPLCMLFFSLRCEGCPVMEKAGTPYCRDTPYGKAEAARKYWFYTGKRDAAHVAHAAAREEVAFLRSLQPAEGVAS